MNIETKSKVGSTASLGIGIPLVYEGMRVIGGDPLSGGLMIGCGTAMLLIREFRFKTAV